MLNHASVIGLAQTMCILLIASPHDSAMSAPPMKHPTTTSILSVKADAQHPRISFLSWDTEGGARASDNLLYETHGVTLELLINGGWVDAGNLPCKISTEQDTTTYAIGEPASVVWRVAESGGNLHMTLATGRDRPLPLSARVTFAWDPTRSPTALLSSDWRYDESARLPALLSAPGHGQMLLSCSQPDQVVIHEKGNWAAKQLDLTLEFPLLGAGTEITLSPFHLPPPRGLKDIPLWQDSRRGWLDSLEPSASGGGDGPANPNLVPSGMLSNNVLSGPASCSLWFYADQAFWTPELAPGISASALTRRVIDYTLDHRLYKNGQVVSYWMGRDYADFLDGNASIPICAWDYVESTGDLAWLRSRMPQIEATADYLARMDTDNDGIVEASQSGSDGSLIQPTRGCSWWDAVNSGGKDGYSNAIIYRSWRCLASLERKLHNVQKAQHYSALADRLKSSYFKAFFNPKTGWLGWWRSADGQVHDSASPIVNAMAIEYGLVDPAEGRDILRRLTEHMRAVGFTRFDLGVPTTLEPLRRDEYLIGIPVGVCGAPAKDDGSDTFGYYMNGGISAGMALHWMAAHYVAGDPGPADKMLRAMIDRLDGPSFQNGVHGSNNQGIDWTTWDGSACGTEGYLAESYRFLQAVMLREPQLRSRYYSPLHE